MTSGPPGVTEGELGVIRQVAASFLSAVGLTLAPWALWHSGSAF
jgi:hypothetical protein